MTVEAVMGLSLFLFMTALLIVPMKIMNTERRMQEALETVGENIAQYASMKEAENQRAEYLALGGIVYAEQEVKNILDSRQVRNISLAKSSLLQDGCTIDLIADYEVYLPFPVFRIRTLKRQQRCCRRAWVGKQGGKGSGVSSEGTDETVYIGKSSTRYHKIRTCHYLFNDISSVSFESIKNMRNKEGKRYYPCSICGKNITGGTVYIMPGGESYHSTAGCSSLTAYVQAVSLRSVEKLGPCSYCSGGSE